MKSGIADFCGELRLEVPVASKLVWKKIFYIGDKISLTHYE